MTLQNLALARGALQVFWRVNPMAQTGSARTFAKSMLSPIQIASLFPRIDECVDHIGAANYVTKLDLFKGYWQVPVTPRAKEISAFMTPDAFLQYTVMPFGVRNAPATFQHLVNTVLSGLSGCEAYLDDIVVYSSSWTDHIQQLHTVFGSLRDANLNLNLAKYEFGQATVTYLGKVVGRD